jgi:hypothetical protein
MIIYDEEAAKSLSGKNTTEEKSAENNKPV